MSINGEYMDPSNCHPYKPTKPPSYLGWSTKHDGQPTYRNLLPYILEPHEQGDRLVRDSPNAVIIHDKFPKAHVHLLVLPKWQPHRDLHPHDAFEDPDFLSMVWREVTDGFALALPMLREHMRISLAEDGMPDAQITSLLDKRDLSKDFQMGIHAHPSQHELHVHIISRDMVSSHQYSPRHYQAFNTPFLVPLLLYPLPWDDKNRDVQYQNDNLLKEDFECWRCGGNFGTDWEEMKRHLKEEWKGWIREGSEGLNGMVANGSSLQ